MVVRGTRKFLDRVGRAEPEPATSSGALGDWYANVLFWRPQVALFTSETAFVPVLIPLAPASSVAPRLPEAFAAVATRIGVEPRALDIELEAMGEFVLAKTASRSVLGVMNEFAHLANHYRHEHETLDLTELSLWLAQVPCGPLDGSHGSPDRALRALLG